MSNQRQRESYEAGKAAHAAGTTRFEYVSESLYDLRSYRAGWDDAEYTNVEPTESTQDNDLATFLAEPVPTPAPIIHTRAGMLEGAAIQYRAEFRNMAVGGRWHLYRQSEGFCGVMLCRQPESGEPLYGKPALVIDVQAMCEQTMRNNLDHAITRARIG